MFFMVDIVDLVDVLVFILYLMSIILFCVLWLCGDVNEIFLVCLINI